MIQTSHARAPDGYTFLPVGTPDLAERCKELSRQKGFTVNVVNVRLLQTTLDTCMDPLLGVWNRLRSLH